ncbi:MAG: hypothetical protein ACTSWN_09410 [Promethearchaeota archaeon]
MNTRDYKVVVKLEHLTGKRILIVSEFGNITSSFAVDNRQVIQLRHESPQTMISF